MNAYVDVATLLKVKFPSAKAALGTVGFTLKNANGTEYAARSTTGVVDQDNGSYSVLHTPSEAWNGIILWDTGEATPLYADEEINVLGAHDSDAIAIATNTLLSTNHGNGLWGGSGGTGSIATTIIVKVNDIPLDNVAVYVTTDIYGNNIVAGTLFTDSFGKVTFMLNAGENYVWKQRAGTNFINPEKITVV